jgi:HlyD family secretion protein
MFSSKMLKYAAIAVSALIIFVIIGKKAGWFGGIKPIVVSTEKVQKRTIYEVITANGKIQPESEVKISSDVSGEIVEMYVKEGDAVVAGQLLLKIKPDIYMSAMDRAEAAVNNSKANYENSLARQDQSKAQLNKVQLAFDRNKSLWEQKTISKAEWDASVAEFDMAKADFEAAKQSVKSAEFGVKSAEASSKEAKEKLYKTSVYAAIGGIITRLNVEKGERVVGTDLMAGTEVLRVANLKRMEVVVEVNENDIVRVNIGDTAIVEVDAFIDQSFKGVVTEIANSANTGAQSSADQVTSFVVKIIMLENSYTHLIEPGKPYPFRPGMTANVDIQTKKRTNVLSVPIEAVASKQDSVLFKNSKTKQIIVNTKQKETELKPSDVVFVSIKSLARVRKVKTGIQDNNFIEIIEGLKENEEVIVAPYSAITRKLSDSIAIKVVEKKDLFNEK